LLTFPRRSRAWRNRAISSSIAFKMWSFMGHSFQLQAKNNRWRIPIFIWELRPSETPLLLRTLAISKCCSCVWAVTKWEVTPVRAGNGAKVTPLVRDAARFVR
jgi:hypothetical protein